tara:strand:+ start:197 stop:355 length:159 start_codon:yes stop_codon:yes gene_type:complete
MQITIIGAGNMEKGLTLEQAKVEGLPEKWSPYDGGFISTDRWIEIIYNSTSK